jgi:hypothetical protein
MHNLIPASFFPLPITLAGHIDGRRSFVKYQTMRRTPQAAAAFCDERKNKTSTELLAKKEKQGKKRKEQRKAMVIKWENEEKPRDNHQ